MSLWSKTRKSKEIDLVLSSSGVRAPCFIGAIDALVERNCSVQRIAGSSGGAIIAAGYALGMPTEEMREIAPTTPYTHFREFHWRNLLSLRNPSVYTGQALDEFYRSIFGDALMKDFEIDCKISVVTIIGGRRILLDRETHPNLPVWKAVRMSSTIPFIFPYLELDGAPVTDGGLSVSMFDIFPDSPRPIIGLRPRADHGLKTVSEEIKAHKLFIWNYLKILAGYLLDAVDNQHVPEAEWHRTIIIPTQEMGGFDFYLTPPDVNRLIKYGYDAVMSADLASLQ